MDKIIPFTITVLNGETQEHKENSVRLDNYLVRIQNIYLLMLEVDGQRAKRRQ
jgi:hypothetical protein